MIKLIAFLGNYGKEYESTRHNVAWQFASSLSFYDRLNWQKKFKGLYAQVYSSDFVQWIASDKSFDYLPEKFYFLKPETYMNLSGESIGELCQFFKIKSDEVLVVHDELELPMGTVSLKWSGGLGGHNGLRSTKANLGTADFWRLRFGISRPADKNIADYVLSNFSSDERIILSQIFPPAGELLAKVLLSKDAQRLLPEWSKKKLCAD